MEHKIYLMAPGTTQHITGPTVTGNRRDAWDAALRWFHELLLSTEDVGEASVLILGTFLIESGPSTLPAVKSVSEAHRDHLNDELARAKTDEYPCVSG